MARDILIVDDEKDICDLIAGILQDSGFITRTAMSSEAAMEEIAKRCPSLVILDIWLKDSGRDGLAMLSDLQERVPDLPTVMISGHGNVETAVSAIKIGAYDYIEKPFNADRLLLVTRRALEASDLRRENSELKRKTWQFDFIGTSSASEKLRALIAKTAPTNSRVFIIGPAGAGKELTARLLHQASARKDQPFITVNAAILEPENMEHVLFGQIENGKIYPGLLEKAHNGSLYIDEIGEMPGDTQNKILRVLVEQEFIRLGGGPNVKVDVRIMSGSSQDMNQLIADGLFRKDLYHRLNVVPINVPSLAERRDDINMLIDHFVDYLTETSGLTPCDISQDVRTVLESHDWPGNVRQLRNCIEYILISAADSPNGTVTMDALPSDVVSGARLPVEKSNSSLMTLSLRDARLVFEREYLLAQVNRFGGNVSKTAEFVGMERSALHRKLKSLGVDYNKKLNTA